jgi:hypothetical protein
MSVTFTKRTATLGEKRSHLNRVINQTFDKSFVNQAIASRRQFFYTPWQTLAQPLPYGNHAAAFAELTKSRFGEGN